MDHPAWKIVAAVVLLSALVIQRGACEGERCDSDKVYKCYKDAAYKIHLWSDRFSAGSAAQNCGWAKNVSACTEGLITNGCTDEVKRPHSHSRRRHREDTYFNLRPEICSRAYLIGTSSYNDEVFEQCLDSSDHQIKELEGSGKLSKKDAECRMIRNEMDCIPSAATGCPPSTSLALEALRNYGSTRLDLEDCPRPGGGNSGLASRPEMFIVLGTLLASLAGCL
uniref:Putative secreted protein n=2 Tax=Ixodes ricinus TaxID=34613 RepID=A0A090XAV8_IXORI